MAALTSVTVTKVSPNSGVKLVMLTTPATADSNDSVNFTTASNGGFLRVLGVPCATDLTTMVEATCTLASSTTVTIDAAGGTTDHIYTVFAFVK